MPTKHPLFRCRIPRKPPIAAFSPSIPAAVTYLSTLLRLASARRLVSIAYKYVFIPLILPPCRQNIRSSGAGSFASLASALYSRVFAANPGISHERQCKPNAEAKLAWTLLRRSLPSLRSSNLSTSLRLASARSKIQVSDFCIFAMKTGAEKCSKTGHRPAEKCS